MPTDLVLGYLAINCSTAVAASAKFPSRRRVSAISLYARGVGALFQVQTLQPQELFEPLLLVGGTTGPGCWRSATSTSKADLRQAGDIGRDLFQPFVEHGLGDRVVDGGGHELRLDRLLAFGPSPCFADAP